MSTIDVFFRLQGKDPVIWKKCKEELYPTGYETIRRTFPDPAFRVVIQHSFRPYKDFVGFFNRRVGINLDIHYYQAFDGVWKSYSEKESKKPLWDTHLLMTTRFKKNLAIQTLPTFNGEFSLAVTTCQKYLRGYQDNYNPKTTSPEACAFYNSDISKFPDLYKTFLFDFFFLQTKLFDKEGIGWFFWTAKTEGGCAPEWDFLALYRHGIIDLTRIVPEYGIFNSLIVWIQKFVFKTFILIFR